MNFGEPFENWIFQTIKLSMCLNVWEISFSYTKLKSHRALYFMKRQDHGNISSYSLQEQDKSICIGGCPI